MASASKKKICQHSHTTSSSRKVSRTDACKRNGSLMRSPHAKRRIRKWSNQNPLVSLVSTWIRPSRSKPSVGSCQPCQQRQSSFERSTGSCRTCWLLAKLRQSGRHLYCDLTEMTFPRFCDELLSQKNFLLDKEFGPKRITAPDWEPAPAQLALPAPPTQKKKSNKGKGKFKRNKSGGSAAASGQPLTSFQALMDLPRSQRPKLTAAEQSFPGVCYAFQSNTCTRFPCSRAHICIGCGKANVGMMRASVSQHEPTVNSLNRVPELSSSSAIEDPRDKRIAQLEKKIGELSRQTPNARSRSPRGNRNSKAQLALPAPAQLALPAPPTQKRRSSKGKGKGKRNKSGGSAAASGPAAHVLLTAAEQSFPGVCYAFQSNTCTRSLCSRAHVCIGCGRANVGYDACKCLSA